MFTAAELTDLRAEQTAAMPLTCTVVTRGAEVDDAYGGTTPGPETTETVACRIGVPSGSDQAVADRLGSVVDATVTLPYGTTVAATARIEQGSRAYEVVTTNDEQAYQVAVRALCRRIA